MQSRSLCYRNLERPDGIERKAVALATCNVRSRELFGFADRTEHDSVLTREERRTGRQLVLACFGFFRFRGNALFQERRINLPVGRRAFPGIFFPLCGSVNSPVVLTGSHLDMVRSLSV